jgi:hypothetical protein
MITVNATIGSERRREDAKMSAAKESERGHKCGFYGVGARWRGLVLTINMGKFQAAAVHHESPSTVSLKIAQRISCVLHRENARAVLRRTPAVVSYNTSPPSGWDSLDGIWQ